MQRIPLAGTYRRYYHWKLKVARTLEAWMWSLPGIKEQTTAMEANQPSNNVSLTDRVSYRHNLESKRASIPAPPMYCDEVY